MIIEFIDYYPVDINPKGYGVKKKADIIDIIYEDDTFEIHFDKDITAQSSAHIERQGGNIDNAV